MGNGKEADPPFRSSVLFVYLGGLGPGAEDLHSTEFEISILALVSMSVCRRGSAKWKTTRALLRSSAIKISPSFSLALLLYLSKLCFSFVPYINKKTAKAITYAINLERKSEGSRKK